MDEWENLLKQLPDTLETSHKMDNPSQELIIHKGLIYLKLDEIVQKHEDSTIVLKWEPYFQYNLIINNCNGLFHLGNSEKILYFSINGEKYFEGRFWELNDKGSHFLIKSIEFGEKPIKLKEAYFDLPNVNVFIGVATKKDRGFTRNRLSITTKDFNFYLDLDQKSDEIKLMLKNKGGTFINARCLLNYKRTISFEKLIVETQSLNYYLSFIFGRWTSSFCIEVPNTNYKYYFSPYVARYIYPSNKFNLKIEGASLNLSYCNFSKMWKVDSERHFLKKIIEWYSEISILQVQHEIGIILGQSCLELMYNHLIKNKNVYLIGRDASDIASENKIRLLLSNFGINSILPYKYDKIKNKYFSKGTLVDGPMTIVKVRNEFVHGNIDGKYFKIERDEIYLVYDLVTAYIELVMIKALEFDLPLSERLKEFTRL